MHDGKCWVGDRVLRVLFVSVLLAHSLVQVIGYFTFTFILEGPLLGRPEMVVSRWIFFMAP